MKAKDKATLHQSSVTELQNQLSGLYQDLVMHKQEIKLGKQANPKIVMTLRNKIAVIKTLIQEKQ